MKKHKYYIAWKSKDPLKNIELFGDFPLTTKRKIKTHEDIEDIKNFILKDLKEEKNITLTNLVITNIIKL